MSVWKIKKERTFEKNDSKKKNTMYYKEKRRGSSLVYKANVLLVYFIKQNTTCFWRVFSIWSDIWLIASSLLKNNLCFLNHVIHNRCLVSCDGFFGNTMLLMWRIERWLYC